MADETGGAADQGGGAQSGGLGAGAGAADAGGAGQGGQSGGNDGAGSADKNGQSADTDRSGGAGDVGKGPQSGEAEKGGQAGGQDSGNEFELPEGYQISDENLGALRQYAADYGIDKAGAQELIDYHVSVLEQQQEAQMAGWEALKSDWANQARSDKALQDSAGNIDQSLSIAKKGVESLGGKELLEVLNMTGVGSHPAVIKAFKIVGENLEGGKIVSGSGGSEASNFDKNLAKAFG